MNLSLDTISENRRNNLIKLINKYYKSINEFCTKNSLDYSAIHRYTSGNMRIGNISLKKFEKIFNLNAGDLDKSNEIREVVEFPIYACLGNYTSVENLLHRTPDTFKNMSRDEFLDYELEEGRVVGIVCDNDAMNPDIKQGWIVLVDLNDNIISDGEIYAILMNNKIMFREIYYSDDDGYLILKPSNTKFNDSLVKQEQISIIGRPSYVIGRFKK
ncbi:MAG: S24 family peptidase [Burkholderiales bacterium]|nr:S24 family peptidase [Burkholderiales bacterium]